MKKIYRVYAMFSGGLDSILSVIYMKKLGYEVIPIFFKTPFFTPENAQKAADENGFELTVIDITKQHIEMMKAPRYGFGKNMNPCIDCHGLMFRELSKLMEENKIDFLISGEILGQRPMSQRKDALNSVAKLSSVKDLIIRPLCQKLLVDTKPIREGWVKKEEMLDIQGRGRYRQIALAKEYGIKSFSNPGGGCVLTDIQYSIKLKDLVEHNMFEEKYIKFLRIGRHFRLSDNVKMIIGRNSDDNEKLSKLITDEIIFKHLEIPGPLAIINSKHKLQKNEIELVASLLLRYHQKIENEAIVHFGENHKLENSIQVTKMPREEVKKYQL
ncbi:MAG: hypothetical protein K8S23_01600 [Candidatus Cloacimonetes bacterium]|nr:hypothetical protein [Candidatus Cloacimonadota bacterium]